MNAVISAQSAPNTTRNSHCWRPFRAAVLTVTAVMAVACSSMDSLDPLEVTLTNISIPEITIFETTNPPEIVPADILELLELDEEWDDLLDEFEREFEPIRSFF